MILVPAFGRDYKSADELELAWHRGKDFLAVRPHGAGYVGKADTEKLKAKGIDSLEFRFRNRQLAIIMSI